MAITYSLDTNDKITVAAKEKWKFLIRVSMITFLFLMLISSIIMFIIYISGGDFGHLNAFYFSLIFLTIVDGFANAFAFCLNGKYSSMLAAGIPLSGFLIPALHNIYKFFYDTFNWDNFDYYVLRLQLFLNITTILFAFIIWSIDQIIDMFLVYKHTFDKWQTMTRDNNNKPCDDEDFTNWNSFINLLNGTTTGVKHQQITYDNDETSKKPSNQCPHIIHGDGDLTGLSKANNIGNWSPILILAISLGTVYAFYPSIAPYSIIDFQYASVVELWILIISAIIPFIIAILDFVDMLFITDIITGGASRAIYGPSRYWDPSGDYKWWNCVWLCAIPYILSIQIFMSLLHYPDSLLSCFFNNNPCRIGFISVLFSTLRETMQVCGFAGAGKQAASGKHMHPGLASGNKPITLFVMMFCVFTGDGYLQHYRRCCRDNWPTTGYTKYQSFFYWLHFGFKGGIKSITSSFTDLYYHNLRPQFISYAWGGAMSLVCCGIFFYFVLSHHHIAHIITFNILIFIIYI